MDFKSSRIYSETLVCRVLCVFSRSASRQQHGADSRSGVCRFVPARAHRRGGLRRHEDAAQPPRLRRVSVSTRRALHTDTKSHYTGHVSEVCRGEETKRPEIPTQCNQEPVKSNHPVRRKRIRGTYRETLRQFLNQVYSFQVYECWKHLTLASVNDAFQILDQV